MTSMFILGILFGIVGTLIVQQVHLEIERYKDRKQAEFEAAVRACAERKLLIDKDWTEIQTGLGKTAEFTERQHVRTFEFNPADPFGDL